MTSFRQVVVIYVLVVVKRRKCTLWDLWYMSSKKCFSFLSLCALGLIRDSFLDSSVLLFFVFFLFDNIEAKIFKLCVKDLYTITATPDRTWARALFFRCSSAKLLMVLWSVAAKQAKILTCSALYCVAHLCWLMNNDHSLLWSCEYHYRSLVAYSCYSQLKKPTWKGLTLKLVTYLVCWQSWCRVSRFLRGIDWTLSAVWSYKIERK